MFDDEDEAFEGNQGIKDQQLALQWVNDNIEKFGGNKNEVRPAWLKLNYFF